MKLALTIIIATAMLAGVAACGEESTEAEPEATTPEIVVPDYEIAKTEDISYADVKRYEYDVVVPDKVTEEQFEVIVLDVIEKAKSEHDFNAVVVFAYRKANEVDGFYTVGKAELSRDGDWAAADTVDAGDYDSMELVVEFGSAIE